MFKRLASSPTGTDVTLEMDDRALPAMLRNQPAVSIDQALLLLHPAEGVTAGSAALQLNGLAITGFAPSAKSPGYFAADARPALAAGLTQHHQLQITDAGGFAPATGGANPLAGFDLEKLEDIVLYVELKAS